MRLKSQPQSESLTWDTASGDCFLLFSAHSKPDSCPERSRGDSWSSHWYTACLSTTQHTPSEINYSLYTLVQMVSSFPKLRERAEGLKGENEKLCLSPIF